MDLFTNKDGNHIIVQNSNSTNSVKYYLLNSSGSVVRNSTIETSGNAEFPNVSGDNDKVYLVYKLGSNLKVRRSTNAGQTWLSDINNLSIGSNTCNGVDIIYADNGVHVVYAMKDSDPNYETYYYKINSNNSWVDYKNVTDYGSEVGGFPTVTFSTDKVHVSYNTGTATDPVYNQGSAKTRDKYTSTWQTPQLVFGGGDGNSGSERAFSDNSSLFDFYYKFITDMGGWHFDLYAKTRTVGGTSWSSPTLIEYYANPGKLVSTSKTNDGKTNIFYEAGYPAAIYHKSFNGANWSSSYSVATISSGYLRSFSHHSISNDLFNIWKESTSSYVKYRQYDAVPLTPTNFTGTTYNNHPKLTWNLINGPDVTYEIWQCLVPVRGSGTWQLLASVNSATGSFVDYGVELSGNALEGTVYYKLRAKDQHPYYSEYTGSLSYNYYGLNKVSEYESLEYKLIANYPNPFNPITKISYLMKIEGIVTIKIYDILGNEVVVLVNEAKSEGLHEVEFDASTLPSGIYFYKMQAGKFTAVNKMLLMR
jgi:hypothetical protein